MSIANEEVLSGLLSEAVKDFIPDPSLPYPVIAIKKLTQKEIDQAVKGEQKKGGLDMLIDLPKNKYKDFFNPEMERLKITKGIRATQSDDESDDTSLAKRYEKKRRGTIPPEPSGKEANTTKKNNRQKPLNDELLDECNSSAEVNTFAQNIDDIPDDPFIHGISDFMDSDDFVFTDLANLNVLQENKSKKELHEHGKGEIEHKKADEISEELESSERTKEIKIKEKTEEIISNIEMEEIKSDVNVKAKKKSNEIKKIKNNEEHFDINQINENERVTRKCSSIYKREGSTEEKEKRKDILIQSNTIKKKVKPKKWSKLSYKEKIISVENANKSSSEKVNELICYSTTKDFASNNSKSSPSSTLVKSTKETDKLRVDSSLSQSEITDPLPILASQSNHSDTQQTLSASELSSLNRLFDWKNITHTLKISSMLDEKNNTHTSSTSSLSATGDSNRQKETNRKKETHDDTVIIDQNLEIENKNTKKEKYEKLFGDYKKKRRRNDSDNKYKHERKRECSDQHKENDLCKDDESDKNSGKSDMLPPQVCISNQTLIDKIVLKAIPNVSTNIEQNETSKENTEILSKTASLLSNLPSQSFEKSECVPELSARNVPLFTDMTKKVVEKPVCEPTPRAFKPVPVISVASSVLRSPLTQSIINSPADIPDTLNSIKPISAPQFRDEAMSETIKSSSLSLLKQRAKEEKIKTMKKLTEMFKNVMKKQKSVKKFKDEYDDIRRNMKDIESQIHEIQNEEERRVAELDFLHRQLDDIVDDEDKFEEYTQKMIDLTDCTSILEKKAHLKETNKFFASELARSENSLEETEAELSSLISQQEKLNASLKAFNNTSQSKLISCNESMVAVPKKILDLMQNEGIQYIKINSDPRNIIKNSETDIGTISSVQTEQTMAKQTTAEQTMAKQTVAEQQEQSLMMQEQPRTQQIMIQALPNNLIFPQTDFPQQIIATSKTQAVPCQPLEMVASQYKETSPQQMIITEHSSPQSLSDQARTVSNYQQTRMSSKSRISNPHYLMSGKDRIPLPQNVLLSPQLVSILQSQSNKSEALPKISSYYSLADQDQNKNPNSEDLTTSVTSCSSPTAGQYQNKITYSEQNKITYSESLPKVSSSYSSPGGQQENKTSNSHSTPSMLSQILQKPKKSAVNTETCNPTLQSQESGYQDQFKDQVLKAQQQALMKDQKQKRKMSTTVTESTIGSSDHGAIYRGTMPPKTSVKSSLPMDLTMNTPSMSSAAASPEAIKDASRNYQMNNVKYGVTGSRMSIADKTLAKSQSHSTIRPATTIENANPRGNEATGPIHMLAPGNTDSAPKQDSNINKSPGTEGIEECDLLIIGNKKLVLNSVLAYIHHTLDLNNGNLVANQISNFYSREKILSAYKLGKFLLPNPNVYLKDNPDPSAWKNPLLCRHIVNIIAKLRNHDAIWFASLNLDVPLVNLEKYSNTDTLGIKLSSKEKYPMCNKYVQCSIIPDNLRLENTEQCQKEAHNSENIQNSSVKCISKKPPLGDKKEIVFNDKSMSILSVQKDNGGNSSMLSIPSGCIEILETSSRKTRDCVSIKANPSFTVQDKEKDNAEAVGHHSLDSSPYLRPSEADHFAKVYPEKDNRNDSPDKDCFKVYPEKDNMDNSPDKACFKVYPNGEIGMETISQCPHGFPFSHRHVDGTECNINKSTNTMRASEPKIQEKIMENSPEANSVFLRNTSVYKKNPHLLVNSLPVGPSRLAPSLIGSNNTSSIQVPPSLTNTARNSTSSSDVQESQNLSMHTISLGTTQDEQLQLKEEQQQLKEEQQQVPLVTSQSCGESSKESWSCHLCGATIKHIANFKRHMKHHLNPLRFPCTWCNAAFGRRDNLNAHVKKHHSVSNKESLFDAQDSLSSNEFLFVAQEFDEKDEQMHNNESLVIAEESDI